MKTRTKNILAVAAIIAVSYTVGKCRGICKLGGEMDKALKNKSDLRVDKVCYDILKNKIAVDLVSNKKEETENN